MKYEQLHRFEIWLTNSEIEEIRQHIKELRGSELINAETVLDRWHYEQSKVLAQQGKATEAA